MPGYFVKQAALCDAIKLTREGRDGGRHHNAARHPGGLEFEPDLDIDFARIVDEGRHVGKDAGASGSGPRSAREGNIIRSGNDQLIGQIAADQANRPAIVGAVEP